MSGDHARKLSGSMSAATFAVSVPASPASMRPLRFANVPAGRPWWGFAGCCWQACTSTGHLQGLEAVRPLHRCMRSNDRIACILVDYSLTVALVALHSAQHRCRCDSCQTVIMQAVDRTSTADNWITYNQKRKCSADYTTAASLLPPLQAWCRPRRKPTWCPMVCVIQDEELTAGCSSILSAIHELMVNKEINEQVSNLTIDQKQMSDTEVMHVQSGSSRSCTGWRHACVLC